MGRTLGRRGQAIGGAACADNSVKELLFFAFHIEFCHVSSCFYLSFINLRVYYLLLIM